MRFGTGRAVAVCAFANLTLAANGQPCHDFWDSGFGNPGPDGAIAALAVFDGSLYVGGDFAEVGNLQTGPIAAWDGTSWSAASSGLPANTSVIDLEEFEGDLFAMCYISGVSPPMRVYKLDGSWQNVTSNLNLDLAYDLYSWPSGSSLLLSADHTACNDGTAIWELQTNGNWTQLSVLPNYGFRIYSMLEWEIDSEAMLLVGDEGGGLFQCSGGTIDVAGGVLAIDSGAWTPVGPNVDDWDICDNPTDGPGFYVLDLEPFDGGIAVGTDSVTTCNGIAVAGPLAVSTNGDLDGWTAPTGEVSWGAVLNLKALEWPGCSSEQLYVGGWSMDPNGLPGSAIVKYEAGANQFYDVDGGIPSSSSGVMVRDMEVYDGALYVGGSFSQAGGNSVSNIARLRRCFADWNNDGVVDTRDVTAYGNDWAADCPCADLNGDGNVDTQDYTAFLNAWAAGC